MHCANTSITQENPRESWQNHEYSLLLLGAAAVVYIEHQVNIMFFHLLCWSLKKTRRIYIYNFDEIVVENIYIWREIMHFNIVARKHEYIYIRISMTESEKDSFTIQ